MSNLIDSAIDFRNDNKKLASINIKTNGKRSRLFVSIYDENCNNLLEKVFIESTTDELMRKLYDILDYHADKIGYTKESPNE